MSARRDLLALLAVAARATPRAARRNLILARVADYFSRPLLIGYIHGVAVVLVIGQLDERLHEPGNLPS